MFTDDELHMIKYALEHLHDTDLSNFKKEDLEALESAMEKLNMEFTPCIDFYYMEDGSKQY